MVKYNRYHISQQQKRLFYQEEAGAEMVTQALMKFKSQIDKNEGLLLLRHLLEKNASLRTCLVSEKGFVHPLQEVLPVEDVLDNLQVVEGDVTVARKIQQDCYTVIDHSNPIALNIVCSKEEFWLGLTISSYNVDSYSFQIISQQIIFYLQEKGTSAEEDEVSYLNFGNWQDELHEDLSDEEKTFWERYRIEPFSSFSFQRNDLIVSPKKQLKTHVVSQDLLLKLKASYPQQLEEVLLVLWASVLAKHNKNNALTLGFIPNGRAFPEIDSLVGLVSSTLPLVIEFKPDISLTENIKLLSKRVEELKIHQYHYVISDDDVVSRMSEVNVGFEYILSHSDTSFGCQIEHISSPHDCHKIKLSAIDNNESLLLQFQYVKGAYSEKTVDMLYEQFMAVLHSLLVQPNTAFSTIALSTVEDEGIDSMGCGVQQTLKHDSVPELFGKIAKDHSNKIAITFNGKDMSYDALKLQSDSVAKVLISKHGISKNDKVGVLMDRSDVLIAVLLGIMKSGATYVPIDPNDSESRIRYIIEDSDCKVIIQDSAVSEIPNITVNIVETSCLWDSISEHVDLPSIVGIDPAYMIYTSGTSGKLKGVPVKHQSLLNYVNWIQGTLDVSETDATALMSSHSFDLGYTSLWGGLLSGATLHIVPEYLVQTPEILVEYLNGNGVTYLKTTPSMFNLLLNEAGVSIENLLKGLRMLILGGEKVNVNDLERVWNINSEVRIVNHYGPTEATIGILAHDLEKERIEYYRNHSIIGRPAYNNSVFVLDEQYQSCPAGISGEIYVSGMSIADGYHNKLEVTHERFIDHTKWDEKLYKTGDEGRWNVDGELEFIGRLDSQVKVNGYRVELSEIESALQSIPEVQDVVVRHLDKDETKVLICYYVSEKFFEQAFFRSELMIALPKYMIPAIYRKIPSIPLTINGKVDVSSLPDITTGAESSVDHMEGTNELERVVLSVWRGVLSNERIGIYDNFFERGGDSIKAIQIASRLHNVGYSIHVSDIFNNPTVASMTLMVKESIEDVNEKSIQGPISMTPVYHYFFENIKNNQNHYNQSFWLNVGSYDIEELNPVFEKIIAYHDIFRLKFMRDSSGALIPEIGSEGSIMLSASEFDSENIEEIEQLANEEHKKFNLEEGCLIRGHLLRKGGENFLLIVMHHLVSDVVSWGILIDDLRNLLQQQSDGQILRLPAKTSSYGDWGGKLNEYVEQAIVQEQLPYWSSIPLEVPSAAEHPDASNLIKDVHSLVCTISQENIANLKPQNNANAGARAVGHIITALGLAFREVFNINKLLLMLESHGREDIDESINLYRTIGWFTALYPIYLEFASDDLQSNLDEVNEAFLKVPQNGIGYGLLRYLSDQELGKLQHRPNIRFNYLGDHIESSSNESLQIVSYPSGLTEDENEARPFEIDIIAYISSGELHVSLSYSKLQFNADKMNTLMDVFKEFLVETLEIVNVDTAEKALSENLTYNALSQEDLESFF